MKHLIFGLAWYASILLVMVLIWNFPLVWYFLIIIPYSCAASFVGGTQLFKYTHR